MRPLLYLADYSDNVQHEYYMNALVGLNTLASFHHDYHAYARFPNLSERLSLKRLEEFIEKNFVTFDYGASYPDIAMCLSYLQYLKCMTMLKDGYLGNAETISEVYEKAVEALGKISITPLKVTSYLTLRGEVQVNIMPQAIKGPKPVPTYTLSSTNGTLVQIGVLDVKYSENLEYVFEQIKHLL